MSTVNPEHMKVLESMAKRYNMSDDDYSLLYDILVSNKRFSILIEPDEDELSTPTD